jgi:capsular polysaccharide export protein
LSKGIGSFSGKHVLLLQGPLGPFFKRLSLDLAAHGARVSKVNFNGGDWLFYPTGAIQFRGSLDDWPSFLARLLADQRVDVILIHGDCRPIHKCVREQAKRAGVVLGVFEEGYVRPDYITLEQGGTNDYSSLPRNRDFYLGRPQKEESLPLPIGQVFWYATLWAILYYLAGAIMKPVFPHYRHHRRLSIYEGLAWIKGLWRKYYYHVTERQVRHRLEAGSFGRFFLVPLQVHTDSQMLVHSSYPSVESFIHEVVSNFAKHADLDLSLVIKHHPMDRGYRDYTDLCHNLTEGYGLQGRLFYVHDLHLPHVLDHASGVVVVNSTVGLSALLHEVPVKVCGRSVYDISGITFSGPLSEFWKGAAAGKPDQSLFLAFRDFLIQRTQLNGNVYKRLPGVDSDAGVVWGNTLALFDVLVKKEIKRAGSVS